MLYPPLQCAKLVEAALTRNGLAFRWTWRQFQNDQRVATVTDNGHAFAVGLDGAPEQSTCRESSRHRERPRFAVGLEGAPYFSHIDE